MHSRQKKIMMMLQKGPISFARAAKELGICEMTLRRDLRVLAADGRCIMIKGGAIMHPGNYRQTNISSDMDDRKLAVAKKIYERLFPVESVFLGTGTTNLALARLIALHNTRPMTIISNSLTAASALFQSGNKVILLGGDLRSTSLDLTGVVAEKNLTEYHVDWLITGCDGASADTGFYTSDMSLCNLERKSISIADRVAVITDSSKFGRKSLVRFASQDEIDLLVTDSGVPEEEIRKLTAAGVECLVCGETERL